MTAAILPGAEPYSAAGGPDGVLVVHGFTATPHTVKDLARAYAAAGYAVECPLLPGHGTAVEDLFDITWADWTAAVEAAYAELAGRVAAAGGRILVAALSMGGTLALWLAGRHPEIAGLVVVNPLCEPAAETFVALIDAAIDRGDEFVPGAGPDIAKPDTFEITYGGTPLRPARSLLAGVVQLQTLLPLVSCPVLLFTSPDDHVVPPSNSDHLAATVSGAVERVMCTRSFHVATLDHDKDEIERRAVEFAGKLTAR